MHCSALPPHWEAGPWRQVGALPVPRVLTVPSAVAVSPTLDRVFPGLQDCRSPDVLSPSQESPERAAHPTFCQAFAPGTPSVTE